MFVPFSFCLFFSYTDARYVARILVDLFLSISVAMFILRVVVFLFPRKRVATRTFFLNSIILFGNVFSLMPFRFQYNMCCLNVFWQRLFNSFVCLFFCTATCVTTRVFII